VASYCALSFDNEHVSPLGATHLKITLVNFNKNHKLPSMRHLDLRNFRKKKMKTNIIKLALIGTCSVIGSVNAVAAGSADDSRFYIGGFGGIGTTSGQSVEQTGTAHKGFSHEDDEYYSYDLGVDVTGKNQRKPVTMLGGQIGYEWKTQSSINPAIEVEASYLSANQHSELLNLADDSVTNVKVTKRGTAVLVTDPIKLAMVKEHVLDTPLSAGNHTFENTAKMKVALFSVNGALTYNTGSPLKPYVGAGAGLAFVNMGDAVSLQTGPGGIETGRELPGGPLVKVNHLNSRNSSNDLTFAAQAKAGLRYDLTGHFSLVAEYRLVHLASTAYTYGSTVYYTHASTNNWVVKNGAMNLHNGLVGIRYRF
jgi:opacity protein-like surface antigen